MLKETLTVLSFTKIGFETLSNRFSESLKVASVVKNSLHSQIDSLAPSDPILENWQIIWSGLSVA